MRYKSRLEFISAVERLLLRAKRSGWNFETASKTQIARWLGIKRDTLTQYERDYGISGDEIRTGQI
jgi:hypothetical protein